MSALASPVYEIPADERRPGFGRLTRVELRKMLDTRSGLWSVAAVAAVTLITVIITALVKGGHDATLARLFNNSVEPAAILLPVLGVLLVCGEWSQRTTLTTFTLVPDRGRVLSAKSPPRSCSQSRRSRSAWPAASSSVSCCRRRAAPGAYRSSCSPRACCS